MSNNRILLGCFAALSVAMLLYGCSKQRLSVQDMLPPHQISKETTITTEPVTLNLADKKSVIGQSIFKDDSATIAISDMKVDNNGRYELYFTVENSQQENFVLTSTKRYYYSEIGKLLEEQIGRLEMLINETWYPCQWSAEAEQPDGTWQFGFYLDHNGKAEAYNSIVRQQADSGEVTIRFADLVCTEWQKQKLES